MTNDQEIVSTQSSAPEAVPQFQTAEYAGVPGTERCQFCGTLIGAEYYRVNGKMACSNCGQQVSAGVAKDSHSAFVRAVLLGCGAALVGLIFYATFTIVTDFYFGYIALAVGWLVAKAMIKGSNGIGGRRYQITAVLLTYAAISMAAVPIGIAAYLKQEKKAPQHQASASEPQNDANSADASSEPSNGKSALGFGGAILSLLFVGIASPFLELQNPVHGAIGLFILFIGLRIAWQMTAAKPLQLDGPYSITAG